jgi:hypothetical protein
VDGCEVCDGMYDAARTLASIETAGTENPA